MKNLIQSPADVLQWTNDTGSAVASGDLIVLRSGNAGKIGVAVTDIADGQTGAVAIKNRVVELPALTGTAFADAVVLYWDDTNGRLTNDATGNTLAGSAAQAKASASAVAELLLND
ncbi:MAG: DUF2190 family protein [Planctomycetota bacterium]